MRLPLNVNVLAHGHRCQHNSEQHIHKFEDHCKHVCTNSSHHHSNASLAPVTPPLDDADPPGLDASGADAEPEVEDDHA